MASASAFLLPSWPRQACTVHHSNAQQGPGTDMSMNLHLRSISKVSFYNASEYDEAGSLATMQRALELGISMLDTAEVYGGEEHENETWIGAPTPRVA